MKFRHLTLTLGSAPLPLSRAEGWAVGDKDEIHWATLWPKANNAGNMALGSDNTIVADGTKANPIAAAQPYALPFPAGKFAKASDIWIAGTSGDVMFIDALVG